MVPVLRPPSPAPAIALPTPCDPPKYPGVYPFFETVEEVRRSDTLLLVDPTEIRKEFSYKMEFVTRVRDASRSSKEGLDVLVNGYHSPSERHRRITRTK